MDNTTGKDSSLLAHYAALERASHEMLEAARAGDWDTVCRLEAACALRISRLRLQSRHDMLEPAEHAERVRMLRQILANDAEIRRICDQGTPAFLSQAPYVMPSAGGMVH